jgi:hypothetical protein
MSRHNLEDYKVHAGSRKRSCGAAFDFVGLLLRGAV